MRSLKIRAAFVTLAILLGLTQRTSADDTVVYGAPKEISPSLDYAVTVDGKKAHVFYAAPNRFHPDTFHPAAMDDGLEFISGEKNIRKATKKMVGTRNSWVSLETTGQPKIVVTPIRDVESINESVVYDERGQKVDHKIKGRKSIEFTAEAGKKYFLYVNKEQFNRFLLFADKPETDKPDPRGKGTFLIKPGTPREIYEKSPAKVLYFAPGYHEIGAYFPLKPNQTIYIAPGAYVCGIISCPQDGKGASGAKIIGRGVLSVENYARGYGSMKYYLPRPITFFNFPIYLGGLNREPANNQVVRGITLCYPGAMAVVAAGKGTVVDNVKILQYSPGCAGIAIGENGEVKNSFVTTTRRSIIVLGSNNKISNNFLVTASQKDMSPFVFGVRNQNLVENNTFTDNTVFGSLIQLLEVCSTGNAPIRNTKMDNTTIINNFGIGYPLLSATVHYSPFRRDKYQGGIDGIEITNTKAFGPKIKSVGVRAFGYSDKAAVKNINVSGFTFNGKESKAPLNNSIMQFAYDLNILGANIAKGIVPKDPVRERTTIPFKGGLDAYPRNDKVGEEFGERIAHDVANGKTKGKSLQQIISKIATGADMSGIQTLPEPKGDFLEVYPPNNDPRQASKESPDYEVSVMQKSSKTAPKKSQVLENLPLLGVGSDRINSMPPLLTEHFANYTHRGSVEIGVRVKKNVPDIEDVVIIPRRYGIKPRISESGREFVMTVDQPRFLIAIINNNWMRPLFLFGNPPEKDIPSPNDKAVLSIKPGDNYRLGENRKKLLDYRVIRFEPGYHDIGINFPIFSDKTIYIAGGAYVNGTLRSMDDRLAKATNYGQLRIAKLTETKSPLEWEHFNNYFDADDFMTIDAKKLRGMGNAENITIRGRGIFSSEQKDWLQGSEDSKGVIMSQASNNGVLEGISVIGRHCHAPKMFGGDGQVKIKAASYNFKIMSGFHGNTDASQWGMYRRNYFSSQLDDGMYFHGGEDIDGWLAWHGNNANVFCIQRKAVPKGGSYAHILIKNVTVIDGRFANGDKAKNESEIQYDPMRGGVWFGFNHDRFPWAYVSDLYMKNIYYETNVNTLFMFSAVAGTKKTKMLTLDNSTFENFSVYGAQHLKSIFGTRPNAPDDRMELTIKNLTIDGKKIRQLEEFANIANDGKNLKVRILP